jgi:two-component system chemotaxis response regulator CheY
MQILIVDDSSTIRRMVRTSLAVTPGGQFAEASTGFEAIEQLAVGSISLMVLDLNMPDMHGFEVLKFIREHRKYCNLPVIVLTTRGDEANRVAALEAGASDFMTKPFVPAELARRVTTLLESRPA